jgi:hypothetical protein
MKSAAELDWGVMIWMPSPMKIITGVQTMFCFASEIWKAVTLVLLMGVIFFKYDIEIDSGGMTYILSSTKIGSVIEETLRLILQLLGRMWHYFYWSKSFTANAVEIDSYGVVYLPSYMKIGTDVEGIRVLRFCVRNLKGSNVGITNGKDIGVRHWNVLRWHGINIKFHDDRYKR